MALVTRTLRSKTPLPTASYTVLRAVQNVHIAGRKVAKDDVIQLTAPQARHWLNEGLIALTPATAPATAPAAATPATGA